MLKSNFITLLHQQLPQIRKQLTDFITHNVDPQLHTQILLAAAESTSASRAPTAASSSQPQNLIRVNLELNPFDAPLIKILKITLLSINNLETNLAYVQHASTLNVVFHTLFSDTSFKQLLTIVDPKMLSQSLALLLPVVDRIKQLTLALQTTLQPLRDEFSDPESMSGNPWLDALGRSMDTSIEAFDDLHYSQGLDTIRNLFITLHKLITLSNRAFDVQQNLTEPAQDVVHELIPWLHKCLAELDAIEETLGLKQGALSQSFSQFSTQLAKLLLKFRQEDRDSLHNPCANYRNTKKQQRLTALQGDLNALQQRREAIGELLVMKTTIHTLNKQKVKIKKSLNKRHTATNNLFSVFKSPELKPNRTEPYTRSQRESLQATLNFIEEKLHQYQSMPIATDTLKLELSDISYQEKQLHAQLARLTTVDYPPLVDIEALTLLRRTRDDDKVKPNPEQALHQADATTTMTLNLIITRILTAGHNGLNTMMAAFVAITHHIYQAFGGQEALTTVEPPALRD
jgi:hypothetical protein